MLVTYTESGVRLGPARKLLRLDWLLLILIVATAAVGFAMLYSAAGGSIEPWAKRQMIRFAVGLVLMLAIALIDIRIWMRFAYAIYLASLGLVVAVEFVGATGMGATRWIDLGFVNLQPSEVMKIALVLALARYFHGLRLEEIRRSLYLLPPLLMVAAPAVLVLRQPDLGTTVLLVAGGGAICFLAGVQMWKFLLAAVAAVAAAPVIWSRLHEYQQQRVLSFLNPEHDLLGAGYHVMQSKIALGSGGVSGKGFLEGTQSHLNFLPEIRTDFVFTMMAEEFGLMGALGLIALYVLILIHVYVIGLRAKNQFGRLTALGVGVFFFLYFAVNIGMVTGLMPAVGVPLPLISYGGTAMLTLLIGFGLVLSVSVHRNVEIPRRDD